ncbi:MAG: hypothetical protein AAGJ09_01655 [Pseudomonadota bacterium]
MASTGLSFAAQNRQAKEQARLYAENAESARASTIAQFDDIALRQAEEEEATSQALFDSRQEALRRRGAAQVSSGEAGVTGNSFFALVRALQGESDREQRRTYKTFENTYRALDRSLDGIEAQGQNQINSVTRGQRPSILQLGVGIGSSVVDGLRMHRQMTGGPAPQTQTQPVASPLAKPTPPRRP